MKEIVHAIRYLFDVSVDNLGQGNRGGVLIWHGQRIAERYYLDPRHPDLSLADCMVCCYEKRGCLAPREASPMRIVRYCFEAGFQFEHNCIDLLQRIRVLNDQVSRSVRPVTPSDDDEEAPPGYEPRQDAGGSSDAGGGESYEGRNRRHPGEAVETLRLLVQQSEADVRHGCSRNALYILSSFGFHFGRSTDSGTHLALLGFLNSLPERLYRLGHLLVFLTPTAEHATDLNRELFADSPFVKLMPAPEPDEESILNTVLSDQIGDSSQQKPDAEVIVCADRSAAWLKRNSSGRNRLFRFNYDRLNGVALTQEELDRMADANIQKMFLDRDLDEIECEMKSRILGQDFAIQEVMKRLRSVQKQVKVQQEQNRPRTPGPLARALLAGPSGTGKSYFARCLSKALFGCDPYEIIMQNVTSRTSLVGAPAGHVGFGQVHSALEALHRSGGGVVLIDEFERGGSDAMSRKAIHDCFMSVFEEGRLDTEDRRQVSFENAIILVTTNLGMMAVDYDKDQGLRHDLSPEERRRAYEEALTHPDNEGNKIEFAWFGRLGAPIVFNPFTEDQMVVLAEREWSRALDAQFEYDEVPVVTIGSEPLRDFYRSTYNPKVGARRIREHVREQLAGLLGDAKSQSRLQRTSITLGFADGKVEVL